MALFRGQLNVYKLETSGSTFIMNMKSQDFVYILSWKVENSTGTPSCYNVMYTAWSRSSFCLTGMQSKSSKRGQVQDVSSSKSSLPNSNLKTVMECSNIRHSFCNLTEELSNPCNSYRIYVQQVTESGAQPSYIDFTPYFNICLAPAHVTVSACPNCINVTVKLSSSLLEVYQELYYIITVTKKDLKQEYAPKTTRQEVSYTIIEDLNPNTNYCITVNVSSTYTKQCDPSLVKCIVIDSTNKPAPIIIPTLAGIFIVSTIFILLVLNATGVICLKRIKWPKALTFKFSLAYSIFESCPEEVHTAQITQKCKKEVSGYNSDEDSESDTENENLYSKRSFWGNSSKPCSETDITEQLSIDCSSTTSEIAEAVGGMAENLRNDINKEESPLNQVFHPSSEENATNGPESEEHSNCLNINLNTVMLGISDKMQDVSAAQVPETEEEAADLKEPDVSDECETNYFTDIPDLWNSETHNLSSAWQKASESEETEPSDSEPDSVGDYMSR